MAEKTRYSDAELEEFKAIILDKLDIAKKDYELLRSGLQTRTVTMLPILLLHLKCWKRGLLHFQKKRPADWHNVR